MKFVRIERSELPSKQTWTDKLMITFKTALPLKCGSLWLYFLVQICKFCNFSLFKKYFVVLPPSEWTSEFRLPRTTRSNEWIFQNTKTFLSEQSKYLHATLYLNEVKVEWKVSKFQRQIFSFEPKISWNHFLISNIRVKKGQVKKSMPLLYYLPPN